MSTATRRATAALLALLGAAPARSQAPTPSPAAVTELTLATFETVCLRAVGEARGQALRTAGFRRVPAAFAPPPAPAFGSVDFWLMPSGLWPIFVQLDTDDGSCRVMSPIVDPATATRTFATLLASLPQTTPWTTSAPAEATTTPEGHPGTTLTHTVQGPHSGDSGRIALIVRAAAPPRDVALTLTWHPAPTPTPGPTR